MKQSIQLSNQDIQSNMDDLLDGYCNEYNDVYMQYHAIDKEANVKTLERYKDSTDQFLYVICKSGNVLFPIGKGIYDYYITMYLHYDDSCAFTLDINGNVTEVSVEKAEELSAKAPSFNGLSRTVTISKVIALLKDNNVINSGLNANSKGISTCSISDTGPASWSQWIQWFRVSGNTLMEQLLIQANQLVTGE